RPDPLTLPARRSSDLNGDREGDSALCAADADASGASARPRAKLPRPNAASGRQSGRLSRDRRSADESRLNAKGHFWAGRTLFFRSEEHTSELQSRENL